MTFRYPDRQWASTSRAFPGRAGFGSLEEAVTQTPYPGSLLGSGTSPGFLYVPSALVLTVGVPMTPLQPTILPKGARVVIFRMSENPPPGLVFDNATGTISGTPTAAQALTNYVMRADAATSYFTPLAITVNP